MRRFLIWSALSAIVGLVIAISGVWAYQHFYARFLPVTVKTHQASIQQVLDETSWVSDGGGGQPLYIIGYRDSAAMQRYQREEVPKLRAAGVEARLILFARPDREGLAQSTAAERATIAELWLTRDWNLYQRWAGTPVRNWTAAGIPAADGNLARDAVVEAGRDVVASLTEQLNDEGLPTRYPLIIWRDREGFMKACACADSRSWAFIRDDLDAPDQVATPAETPVAPIAPEPLPEAAAADSPPYPTVPPVSPTPPAASGSTPAPAPAARTAPIAPRPASPPPARKSPEPKQGDDTTFF